MYRSDRLLRQTAAGAAVVTYPFRGIDLMLPPGSVWVVREQGDTAVLHEGREREESPRPAGAASSSGSSPAVAAWTEEHTERVGEAVVEAVTRLLRDASSRARMRRLAQVPPAPLRQQCVRALQWQAAG